MVDDSHAVGFIGENGRGTHEHCGVLDRVDIITGTLGKALGGASGGYTSGKKEVIDWLRQRSRPYLFSNSLAPSIVSATIKVIDMLAEGHDLRQPESEQRSASAADERRRFHPGRCRSRHHAGDAGGCQAGRRAWRAACWQPASTSSASPSRWCPRAGAHPHPDVCRPYPEQLDKAIDAFIRIGREGVAGLKPWAPSPDRKRKTHESTLPNSNAKSASG
jgi:glycine C-acetyltransferase